MATYTELTEKNFDEAVQNNALTLLPSIQRSDIELIDTSRMVLCCEEKMLHFRMEERAIELGLRKVNSGKDLV